jgi:hypothetical protein
MRWVGHVACLAELRNAYKILVGKLEGRKLLGLGIDGRIMLE